VIAELKALKQLTSIGEALALNYLKASGFQVALLLNFGALSLQQKRLVFSPSPVADSGLPAV
jgi:GxxExxY protein